MHSGNPGVSLENSFAWKMAEDACVFGSVNKILVKGSWKSTDEWPNDFLQIISKTELLHERYKLKVCLKMMKLTQDYCSIWQGSFTTCFEECAVLEVYCCADTTSSKVLYKHPCLLPSFNVSLVLEYCRVRVMTQMSGQTKDWLYGWAQKHKKWANETIKLSNTIRNYSGRLNAHMSKIIMKTM